MKKRFLVLITIAIAAFVLPTLLVACDNTQGEKAEYSVTVLSPDEQPLSNITVSWLSGSTVAGTATTDANGKASATLTVGTYTVTLANYAEGLEYDSFSVTSAMPITVTLNVKRITYTVTVMDKENLPAANVTVNWMSGNKIAGTAATDADGKATKELDYGDYTVTLNNLPAGNISNGTQQVSGANPTAEFKLRNGEAMDYTVTVKSEGGLIFKKQTVVVYIEGDDFALTAGETNENGEYTFSYEAGSYIVAAEDVPEGYSPAQVKLTADNDKGEIRLHSEIIKTAPSSNQTYVLGDIFHDYEFETPYEMANGQKWSGSIAKILETKEAIILNNWGLGCSFCIQEMPAIQEFYEKYSDKIEIIAVNNYSNMPDSDAKIISFYKNYGYTFPMMRDTHGFVSKFGFTGWPQTVIIDRYGAIARIESGAVSSVEAWEYMINKYIGDDYVQTFIPGNKVSDSIIEEIAKPDITVPEDHYEQIADSINMKETFTNASVTWYGETKYDMAWPFLIDTVEGISPEEKVLFASNTGKAASIAIIYANVDVPAGRVFTFDYYIDNEDSDIFYLFWDGKIVREISGNNKDKGWQTCYLYTDLADGEHDFAIAYQKDSSVNEGKDNMYVRRVRFVDVADIDQPTDIFRSAAYGIPEQDATVFPYYAKAEIGSDGYYHVILSDLHNSHFAGVDESPLLFISLNGITPWNTQYPLRDLILGVTTEGTYAYNCTFRLGDDEKPRDYREDLKRYISAASSSDIKGFVPVNQFLHDFIVAFMPQVSGNRSHDNEWLEACYFYSHYGSNDNFIGNPIIGLMKETAIEITNDVRYTADLTRIMVPFPSTLYTFTPAEDGIYKFESFIADKDANIYAAQIWLFDDNTSAENPLAYSGEDRINLDGKNEQNFEMYYVMKAGHKYYIELAFLMAESGKFDFEIIKEEANEITRLEPTSGDVFTIELDENGNLTDKLILVGAIDYVEDDDGYFHSKNDDGSMGGFIYLDVLNANTTALGTIPLYKLVNKFVQDPLYDPEIQGYPNLAYKYFDLRYCVMYYKTTNDKGEEIDTYFDQIDLSTFDADIYKDYTEIMKNYIDSAPTSGEYKGLIKVNQEIIDILSLYIELRVNGIWATKVEGDQITEWSSDPALYNEWLRFCWYHKTYKAEDAQSN